jgi:DNA mismatch repair protein MSH3
VEVVAPESLSNASRDIVLAYLDQAQRRQPQQAAKGVEADDEADDGEEEEEESATEAKAPSVSTTCRLMQRIKWLSPKIYSTPPPPSSSSALQSWNKVLSPVGRLAMRGLHEYLREFQLESVLESPSANIHDPLLVESSASAPCTVPSSSGSLPLPSAVTSTETSSFALLEPSFPLDGVTVRDLELFDSFSNANEALRGISKLMTYQQQYLQHQQHRKSHTTATTTKTLSGGLFSVLDRCGSVYGRRTLKNWLLNPLCHVPSIRARQEAITWLLPAFTNSADVVPYRDASVSPAMLRQEVQHFVHRVQDTLKRAPDIEKMLTSLQFNRIAPSRLKALLALAIRLQGLYVAPIVDDHASPGADATPSPSLPSLLRRPDYLPSWLTYHIRRVNFQQLAKQAMQFDEAIVLTTVASFAAASHTSDYDPTKIAEESLTGFFDAATEDRYPALAALRAEKQEVEAAIAQELQAIRTQLRKPQLRFTSLRSGALSCIEHLIELPLAEEKKVPGHWIKMNSTKQVVRFHVPTVIAWQEQLYRIRDECKIVGRDTWRSFVSEVKVAIHEAMRTSTAVLGALDAMLSLAQVSAQPGYVCPEYTAESIASTAGERRLHIEEGRHPVLEKRFADSDTPYLANNVHLTAAQASQGGSASSASDRLVQIVTGPNLGGKSSYCRMVALLALLGQLGAYVPARRAEMVVFDNILTRMGSEDDLHSGRSTFLCELVRTNAILRHATSRSLVVIDELGRGTATHDGYAIAQATLWYLLDRIRCFTLFITHFPQIAQFRRQWLRRSAVADQPSGEGHEDTDPIATDGTVEAHVVLSHMSYVERVVDATTGETEVTFLYKLVESPARGSFGINVARLAGMKKSILERAMSKAREMQEVTWSQWSQGRPTTAMDVLDEDRPTVAL